MSWVGRVTRRRRLALSESGAGSSGKKNLEKSRDQTKHVTRGIEHVGKDGLKAISNKYLTADRTGDWVAKNIPNREC